MNKFYLNKIFYFVLLSLLVVISCEYDAGTEVWKSKETYQPDPVITRIDPDGSVFTDVMEIRIIGENFLSDKEKMGVFFDEEKANVISASETEIVVTRPKLVGDAVKIKVWIDGALQLAEYPNYKLFQVSQEWSTFGVNDVLYGIAVDKNENLFAHLSGGYIWRVDATGKREVLLQSSILNSKMLSAGPNETIFINWKVPGKAQLNTIASGATAEEVYHKLPKACYFFDFDQNDNIYSAGPKTGVYLTDKTTVTSKAVGNFVDYDIVSIRVFDNKVYVSALYTDKVTKEKKDGIYFAPIDPATGDLGPVELYYDWKQNAEFSAVAPGPITFTEDGDLLVGTANANPILRVRPDRSAGPLYEGLLTPSADFIVYGNNEYLYYLRGDSGGEFEMGRVIRVRMAQKGAPYYGRIDG